MAVFTVELATSLVQNITDAQTLPCSITETTTVKTGCMKFVTQTLCNSQGKGKGKRVFV